MEQSTVGSLVGYNVKTAVDTMLKLIVSHEVTNSPVDRGQLIPIARMVKNALHGAEFMVLADQGYFKGKDIRSCVPDGTTTLVPKSRPSGSGTARLFPRSAFKYNVKKAHTFVPPPK